MSKKKSLQQVKLSANQFQRILEKINYFVFEPEHENLYWFKKVQWQANIELQIKKQFSEEMQSEAALKMAILFTLEQDPSDEFRQGMVCPDEEWGHNWAIRQAERLVDIYPSEENYLFVFRCFPDTPLANEAYDWLYNNT